MILILVSRMISFKCVTCWASIVLKFKEEGLLRTLTVSRKLLLLSV